MSRYKTACEALPFPCSVEEKGHLLIVTFTGDGWAIPITIDTNTDMIYTDACGDTVTEFAEDICREIRKALS
jgi:hypothetical protein